MQNCMGEAVGLHSALCPWPLDREPAVGSQLLMLENVAEPFLCLQYFEHKR